MSPYHCSARESAARKGQEGWRFTLQAPDYFAVMTYLDRADIRRQVYDAYSVRATSGQWDNRPLIVRILDAYRNSTCDFVQRAAQPMPAKPVG